jgi:hypothetical protein
LVAQVLALFDELKTQLNEIETQLAALRKDTKLAPDARADKLTVLEKECNAAKKVRFERSSECSFALGDCQSILRESASPSGPWRRAGSPELEAGVAQPAERSGEGA